MNLQLLITKKEIRHYNTRTKTKHLFAVIDLDKSKNYPQNFVSLLPKKIDSIVKPSNLFEEKFGNDSVEVAKQLLEKALKKRPNSETSKAIRDRLKILAPKLISKTNCQQCGKPIKQYKKRFRTYKFCYECHLKRYAK
jgi:hypothetical protein